MKLKKLLAAVTAAALAVTTMAVTSFTVSAATSSVELPEGTEIVLNAADLSGKTVTGTGNYTDFGNLGIGNVEPATMSNPNAYVKLTVSNAGTGGDNNDPIETIVGWGWASYSGWLYVAKWYNNYSGEFEATFTPIMSNGKLVCYVPISNFVLDEYNQIGGNFQTGNTGSVTIDALEVVEFSQDTTVYTSKTYTPDKIEDGSDGGANAYFTGTWDLTKAVGPNARVEFTFASTPTAGFALCDGNVEEWWGAQKIAGTSSKTSFKISDIAAAGFSDPIKIIVNGWGTTKPTGMIIYNGSSDELYTPGGSTPDPDPPTEDDITISTTSKTISVGESFDITVTVTPENMLKVFPRTSDLNIVTVVPSTGDNGVLTYRATGVAKGTATLTFQLGEDVAPDGSGNPIPVPPQVSCVVTVTDSTTTDPATVNLEFPTTPIEIPVYQSESNILASVEIPFTIDGNKTYEDVKDTTYIINGINFTSIAKDGKELELKNDLICISMPGDGKVTTLKKGDKNKSIIIDMSTIVNDENKTAKFEKVVLILSFGSVKDSGLAVGDKIVLNGGTTPPDPGHTHTPAATWTSDATGHWHACSDCDEKLDFAAHTSDGGKVTIPATETTTGVKTYKCTECGYVIKTETIPAIGITPSPSDPSHNYTGGAVIPIINNGSNSRNPSISGDNGKSGWDAIVSEIAGSGDGSKVSVDMNSATKVPSSIMKEIEGLDIDLVLNMGRGIKWTINGLSVTGHKNIDFGVSKNTRHIPNDVVSTVEGTYKKQISLDHNGNFGCTAALTVDVGTKYNGLYANMFYYNPKTESLELTDCSLISGGNAKFMFTHASDYLITVTAEPLGEFEDVSSAAGIASDNNSIGNGIALSAVLTAIVLGFGIVVYKKRRHN